jgi:DNA replicative helicase MCM subunit Mcm2 (Cdc46/Mcm family)
VIINYWSGHDSRIFPTNRVLEAIVRVSMACARLHFSNIVAIDLAKKTIYFITRTYKPFDSTVIVVQNSRGATCHGAYLGRIPVNNKNNKRTLLHAGNTNLISKNIKNIKKLLQMII